MTGSRESPAVAPLAALLKECAAANAREDAEWLVARGVGVSGTEHALPEVPRLVPLGDGIYQWEGPKVVFDAIVRDAMLWRKQQLAASAGTEHALYRAHRRPWETAFKLPEGHWVVWHDDGPDAECPAAGPFATEAEAIAVRDALNRVASAGPPAERPPECPHGTKNGGLCELCICDQIEAERPPEPAFAPTCPNCQIPTEAQFVCERCGHREAMPESVPVLPDTMNEIRLGVLPSVNLRNGVAFSYCPECGTEAGPSATRVPVLQPEPSTLAQLVRGWRREAELRRAEAPDVGDVTTQAAIIWESAAHELEKALRAVDSVSRSPEPLIEKLRELSDPKNALWNVLYAATAEREDLWEELVNLRDAAWAVVTAGRSSLRAPTEEPQS